MWASRRLEIKTSIGQINLDFQAEISASFDNLELMSGHFEYVEAQIACSSHRANQTNPPTKKLTSDLTEKENCNIDLHDGNDNTERKFEAVF